LLALRPLSVRVLGGTKTAERIAVYDEAEFRIEPAKEGDTPVILRMITALVDHERLSHELTQTEPDPIW
jgi:hypothetical protein